MIRPLRFLLAAALAVTSLHAGRRADHVFIISFDGMKPAVVHETEMPVLRRLVAEGAVTWAAQTINPPKTLPSHTSMLTGVGPDKHQVLWNNYEPLRGRARVPTIFALAKQHDAALGTAMLVGKVKFRHLWQRDALDLFDNNGPQEDKPAAGTDAVEKSVVPAQTVARNAVAHIEARKPNLCFIHFADVDSAGHKSGWGSPEQKEALRVCDQALGQVVRAVERAGLAESSVLLISADHGGLDKSHNDPIPENLTIPWIAWGKGARRGHTIAAPVATVDTAATALWLLDIPRPQELDGKPVTEAFQP